MESLQGVDAQTAAAKPLANAHSIWEIVNHVSAWEDAIRHRLAGEVKQPERNIPVDRYAFEKQETEARAEKDLYCKGEKFGRVLEMDLVRRTVDVKKTKKTVEFHPTAVYV